MEFHRYEIHDVAIFASDSPRVLRLSSFHNLMNSKRKIVISLMMKNLYVTKQIQEGTTASIRTNAYEVSL